MPGTRYALRRILRRKCAIKRGIWKNLSNYILSVWERLSVVSFLRGRATGREKRVSKCVGGGGAVRCREGAGGAGDGVGCGCGGEVVLVSRRRTVNSTLRGLGTT